MGTYNDPQLPNQSDGRTYDPPEDMPNKGTGTGFISGMGHAFGADTGADAINRLKGIGSSSDSDPMDQCYQDAGDYKAQNQPGNRSDVPNGKGITAACDSDGMMEVMPSAEPDQDD